MSKKLTELNESLHGFQAEVLRLTNRSQQLESYLVNICTIVHGESSTRKNIWNASAELKNMIDDEIKMITHRIWNVEASIQLIRDEIAKENELANKRLQKRKTFGGMQDFELPLSTEKIRFWSLSVPTPPMHANELNRYPRSEIYDHILAYKKDTARSFIDQLNSRAEPNWGTANIIRKLTTELTA